MVKVKTYDEIMQSYNDKMLKLALNIVNNIEIQDGSELEILAQIERRVQVLKEEARDYDPIKTKR